MDIFVFLILLVSSVQGARKGFMDTLKSFLQWFLCLVFGILFCSITKELLINYTNIDEWIQKSLVAQLTENNLVSFIPDACSSWIGPELTNIENEFILSITSMLMTIISFFTFIIGLKAILLIFTWLFSKKYHDGVTGFIDGALGAIFGFARGIFYILLLFLVFIPLFSVCFPQMSESVALNIENSMFANIFYNDNILLIILQKLFS